MGMLRRTQQPSLAEIQYWIDQLNSGGMTRGQVTSQISYSAEAQSVWTNQVKVSMIYNGMLRFMFMPADGIDSNFWVQYLVSPPPNLPIPGDAERSMIYSIFYGEIYYRHRFMP